MPLTSVNEMKIMLQVSGSSKDEIISTLLPVVTNFIEGYCYSNFMSGSSSDYSSSYQQVYPDGLKLAAAHMIEYMIYAQHKGNITNESIGAYSVGYATQFPQEITDMLKPYRKVRFT